MDDFNKIIDHDFYRIDDIDQINDDIDKALNAETDKVTVVSDSNEIHEVPQNPYLIIEEPIDAPEVVPDVSGDAETFVDAAFGTNFYRESIKAEFSPVPKQTMGRFITTLIIICTLGTTLLGFGLGLGYGFFSDRLQERTDGSMQHLNLDGPIITSTSFIFEMSASVDAGSLADVIERIEPAVVNIVTYRQTSNNLLNQGSGIIFAEDDDRIFIVTNRYVVTGGDQVEVYISGMGPVNATSVGSEPSIGLSVISVYKHQLLDAGIDTFVVAAFGDSERMRVGDIVMAIGNAMGEGNSVTRGVVSAAESTLSVPGLTNPLQVLQTDAAINIGNSGGPLINIHGEIVGINNNQISGMIFGTSQIEGIGYSVSSNVAAPILLNIINNPRPAIGIRGNTVTAQDAARLGIPQIGVIVGEVTEGGPAEDSGLRVNDVITSYNGQPVLYFDQFVDMIRASRIGDVVELTVLREGSAAITIELTLGRFIDENF